ncbi:MAG: serine hydrolase [bacterium]
MQKYIAGGAITLIICIVLLGIAHSSSTYVSRPFRPSITASIPEVDHSPILLAPVPAASAPRPAVIIPAKTEIATPVSPITAGAYLVGNAETGEVYVSKNTKTVGPIASISKLFTALVAQTAMDPNQTITITQRMLDVYPNAYGFSLGEKFTLSDLLYPLLVQSNNNVAEGIAQTYGYDMFIFKMNSLALSLGLTRTHFEDASGLSDSNISNAQDLFTFGRFLYTSKRPLLTLTTTYSWNFASTTEHSSHSILSTDPFIGDPHLVGGKTGRTDAAGETMLTIFNYALNGKNYPIAIVVLHSDPGQRQNDSVRLLFQAIAVINSKK